MAPSTRKKLLIGGGGVAGFLILALLIAPSFIDVNKYKPEIVAQVKKATGRDLVLDGPVTLSLLPAPAVGVSGVRFVNVPGSKNANMVEVKSITVKPSLLALLGGNVEVSSVTLMEPKIVLEINAEGKPNWEFAPSVEAAKPAAAKPAAPTPVSIGSLVIENGTLLFSDSKAGISLVAEKANVTASVGSLDGPYALAGSATLNGAALKLDVSVGAKAANGYATSIALEANGTFGFKGTLSELGPNARLAGVATVSADSLPAFITTLMGLAGRPVPVLPPVLAGKFTFEGGVEAAQTDFAAKDFKMTLNDSVGSGALALKLKPALVVDGKVTMSKLDLDKAFATLSRPAPVATAPPPATRPPAAPAPAEKNAGLLDGVTAKFALDVGEVIYNRQSVRNVALEIDARGGAVAVPRLAATLPGDMVLQAKSTMAGEPARPTVSGDFSLAGPKLRETLKWLDVDVSSVPATKLTKVSLKGRMASANGDIQVTDAVFELDDLKGTGGVQATLGAPPSFVTHVEIETLDLDSFTIPQGEPRKAAPAPNSAAAKSAAVIPPQSEPAFPLLGLKLKIAKVIYNKETIGGVDLDTALQGSTVTLNRFDIGNLGGGRLAVRGNVANFSVPQRRSEIAFNFEAPDIDRVLKIFGGSATGLGKTTASGVVAGTQEQMSLRELTVASATDTVKMTGAVSMPGASTGTPSSVGYKGSISINNQTIECVVDIKVATRPTITVDLKAASLDLDKLQARAAPPARPARGQPAVSPAAAKPIDTGPMRGVDASVKLAAGTLVSAPLRINNADLALGLKNGVLSLQHFKGGLYGGTVDFSGTVDGSKPALAIDLKGDANNISVGEMLRETSGANTFGSAVKVTIDGKLNATGIAIKGSGSTADQIKASMTGGADLGGYISAGADRALMALGGAATGAVGGVIDNTLGTALGAIGQRGGSNVGNILNAASLLINRFANHDNPVSGHVDIAGGVLTDKSLVVKGNRATANVATRTNLATSTTDTTVNFMIAEDSSGPYVTTTARGPIASPSLNVTRGPAKDPPGFVNTLTNGIGGSIGSGVEQVPSIIPKIPLPNIFGR
jgi:uncharacterized protein involved in outer membrane biogenesis